MTQGALCCKMLVNVNCILKSCSFYAFGSITTGYLFMRLYAVIINSISGLNCCYMVLCKVIRLELSFPDHFSDVKCCLRSVNESPTHKQVS